MQFVALMDDVGVTVLDCLLKLCVFLCLLLLKHLSRVKNVSFELHVLVYFTKLSKHTHFRIILIIEKYKCIKVVI